MPELPAGYRTPPSDGRPVGLRRRRVPSGSEFWRIDAEPPKAWSWEGFAEPRHRFDPASGEFRTRYASRTFVGAARERYQATGLYIPADHASHRVVRLVASRHLLALDLRIERNLDVLGVDDQVSTGQHAEVWTTCQRLADAARRWWDDLDAIVYRSRTSPVSSVNLAFFSPDAFTLRSWALADRKDLLTDLVLRHDFTLGWSL